MEGEKWRERSGGREVEGERLSGKAVRLVIQKVLGSNPSRFISLSLSWKKSSALLAACAIRPDQIIVLLLATLQLRIRVSEWKMKGCIGIRKKI